MVKTFTLEQMQAFIDRDDWQRETYLDIIENGLGQGCVRSTLEGVTITYKENFYWNDGDTDSLEVNTQGQSDVWTFEGVNVTDDGVAIFEDDGEYPDTEEHTHQHLDLSGFSSTDYSGMNYDFE